MSHASPDSSPDTCIDCGTPFTYRGRAKVVYCEACGARRHRAAFIAPPKPTIPRPIPKRRRVKVLGKPISSTITLTRARVDCSVTICKGHPKARPCRARAVTMYDGRPYCINHRPTIEPPSTENVKLRARRAVKYAIKTGVLTRQPCAVGVDCDGPIEAHHPDYSRPLDVRWLCRRHHRAEHARTRGAQ